MPRPSKYAQELRERAVRMVFVARCVTGTRAHRYSMRTRSPRPSSWNAAESSSPFQSLTRPFDGHGTGIAVGQLYDTNDFEPSYGVPITPTGPLPRNR